jgi:hypothetical protein
MTLLSLGSPAHTPDTLAETALALGRNGRAPTRKQPPREHQTKRKDEEAEIPGAFIAYTLTNVMERENVVVDNALDEVEEAPTKNRPAKEGATANRPSPLARPSPEEPDTDRHSYPRGGVEEAVREHVVLESSEGRGRVVTFAREEVVPLEDLVENDAVDEPPEADANEDSGRSRTDLRLRPGCAIATSSSDEIRARQADKQMHAIAGRPKLDIATLQGFYFLATGVWPLLSRRSFERVTGPKAVFWLAQTVGVLVAGVGSAILQAKRRDRITPEIELLGIASAAGLGLADLVFVARARISKVYLVDALAEAGLVGGWLTRKRR